MSEPAYLCGGTDGAPHPWSRLDYWKLYAPGCDEYICLECGNLVLVRHDVSQSPEKGATDPAIVKPVEEQPAIGFASETSSLAYQESVKGER